MTNKLGPKPVDPSKISFSPDCFVEDGYEEEWIVILLAPNYPKKFADRASAEAYSKIVNRPIRCKRKIKFRRIKWF